MFGGNSSSIGWKWEKLGLHIACKEEVVISCSVIRRKGSSIQFIYAMFWYYFNLLKSVSCFYSIEHIQGIPELCTRTPRRPLGSGDSCI